jgi:hypothetical protein
MDMGLLILIAVVIVVLILALMLVDALPLGEPPLKNILKAIVILIAILVICQRAGLLALGVLTLVR